MATTKRERQRANREARQEALKKKQSRAVVKKRAFKWSKVGIVIVTAFLAINWLLPSNDEDLVPTPSTTLVETTQTP